ncbi:MAG: type II toxin-antitoxin system RelE/ParE family toxin [Planctomycetes bacterium]|nr:type II toxin-antitoxin system RelE/ParE family toxin [Planctomycetota bacterium]
MSYRIEIDRQALKVLAALPKKVQRQIAERSDALTEKPFPPDAQQSKGQEAIWRIRSGSYRIAYTLQRNVLRILVLRSGSRRDFYRHFNR